MLSVQSALRTSAGRVRGQNEDAAWAGERVWAVADGMGGHASGEVASRMAIDDLVGLDTREVLTQGDLVATIQDANRRIRAFGRGNPASRGLGTTLTGVARVDEDGGQQWVVFNVGDSRTYLMHDGRLEQISVDHSESQELVDAGVITADEARHHRARHIITRSLGQPFETQVDVWPTPASTGDRFLICSDGLTEELTDERISAILTAFPQPRDAVEALVDAALVEGGRDNITVLVVQVEDAPDHQ